MNGLKIFFKYGMFCLLTISVLGLAASCSSGKKVEEDTGKKMTQADKEADAKKMEMKLKEGKVVKKEPEQVKTEVKKATKDVVTAKLEPKSGSNVTGEVKFQSRKGAGIIIRISASGLKPRSIHGFHIHEKGDCSAADGSSAGGHFSPDDMPHGSPASEKRHAGDLGNMQADKDGKINRAILVGNLSLDSDDEHSVLNRAVVLHADPDDYKSQPSGNAGKRIACAVIK